MDSTTPVQIDVHVNEDEALASMPLEVRAGLHSRPKRIPSKYFYDEEGSALFERITRLPEYYPTRTELSILEGRSDEICEIARPVELLELGAGSARKTEVLLEAAIHGGRLERYLPFDVSLAATEMSVKRLAEGHPELAVHGIVGDYERHLGRIPTGRNRLVAFLGGTIGNFSEDRAIGFLQQINGLFQGEGWVLLGTDLVKEVAVLEAAYNDAQGITAAFNRNILNVLNQRLGGDAQPEQFEHVAFFNRDLAQIELHLESKVEQTIHLKDLGESFRLAAGERIQTEISRKFSRSSVERLFNAAGLDLEHWYTDPDERFALSLARHA